MDERDPLALMVGDVVYDRRGLPWRIERLDRDTGVMTLTKLNVIEAMTIQAGLPAAGGLIIMTEGPGWGEAGGSIPALDWAINLIQRELGPVRDRE